MQSRKKTLFLIPSTLGDSEISRVIPEYNLQIIQNLGHFAVEEEKTARRFLIRCGYSRDDISGVNYYILNEHTPPSDIPDILKKSGDHDIGLLSEAGLPAVADPGALLVQEAHRMSFPVVPLSGPSSLMLALMASGLNFR
jgi:16S rRNA (cytidine1402-2'-O)-methyltransferase